MRGRPVEPPVTGWSFPELRGIEADDLIAIGADLAPGTVLSAYRGGLFPMYVQRRRLGWWSPNPRGIIPLDGLKVSRATARSTRRFDVRTNTSFEAVMQSCADPRRPHGWITRDFVTTYTELHHLGWAHSVETWHEGRLVGGLYGVAIGGLFAGESMFHRETDASKVALVALVERLRDRGFRLLDVQWTTEHLASLGAIGIARDDYLDRLDDALGASAGWEGPWEP